LSKLVNLKAWRGKIVDDVISTLVIPAVNRRTPIALESARQAAYGKFNQHRTLGMRPNGIAQAVGKTDKTFAGFLEVEHGKQIADQDFDKAWLEIDQALRGFFANRYLWKMLQEASVAKAQCFLPFSHDGASVTANPDVLCFYSGKAPLIIDWKVQSNPIGNYWLQLATYAIALTRCKPQPGWPALPSGITPSDVNLAEVQLLTGVLRTHTVTRDEVEEIEELITCSTAEMALACMGRAHKDLRAEDFPTARSPSTCQYCPFMKPCWECGP
jgi:hypothetical protein